MTPTVSRSVPEPQDDHARAPANQVVTAATHAVAHPQQRPTPWTVALIASFPALSPLSVDIAQPAMPQVATGLAASPAQVGLTLSLFMAGFAIAQLVVGPLSDRLGRKPPLTAGCLAYAVAGLGCSMAPDIETLLVTRLLQGLGAGACVVVAFAMVRDRFEGAAARTCLAYVNGAMWLAPIIAPTLGVALLAEGDWRFIYAALAATGLALLAVASFGMKESIRQRKQVLSWRGALRDYGAVLAHRSACAHAVLVGLGFGAMFAYVAGAPWAIMSFLHLSASAFALTFALIGAGLTTGSLLCARVAARGVEPKRLTSVGLWGLLASSLILLVLVLGDEFRWATAVPILFVNGAALGLAMPGAVHGVLQPFPALAGTASAVQGFLRMLGAAASSALVAALHDGSPLPMTLAMTLFSSAAVFVWLFAVPSAPSGALDSQR